MTRQCQFTVFTPTFNRARTLSQVYESLKNQTYKNFEWLIVDDGSTDDTPQLIRNWQLENIIPIRYFHQNNGGKHTGFNRAVREAFGELFLPLDDDDACVPNALQCLRQWWEEIPSTIRNEFSGVTCHCINAEGKIIGSRFPRTFFDSDPITAATIYKVTGEKWGFHRTEILRQYPYPQFPGEKLVPDGLVWNRIGMTYKIRFVDEPLRIHRHLPGGITSRLSYFRAHSPSGTRLYYLEYAKLNISRKYKIKAVINYFRFSAHGKISPRGALAELNSGLFGVLLMPLGYMYYLLDLFFLYRAA